MKNISPTRTATVCEEMVFQQSNNQTTQPLNISSEWNNLIFNSSPDLIYSYDKFGRFTSANNTMCKALNRNIKDIIGKTNADLGFSEELCNEWANLHLKVYNTNAEVTAFTRIKNADNNTSFYKVILNPLHDDNGNIIGIGGITRDITEHKKNEEALLKSREDFYIMVQNAPDIIAVYIKGEVIFINKKGLELLKASSIEDIVGKPILQFVHPDYKELVKSRMQTLQQSDTSLPTLEEKFICVDGSSLDVEVKAMPTKFGQQDAVIIFARDISDRKKAQEALKMERALFRTVIDNIPDSIYVKDINGKKLIANPQDLKYMGLELEKDAIGKTDADIYASKKIKKLSVDDDYVIKNGKSITNKIEFFIDNQQQEHWLLTSRVPLRNECNEIIGLVGIGHDITDRQKMIDQLYASQERINKIILSSSDCIWEIDSERKLVYCSDKVEQIFGYKSCEVIGRSMFEMLSEPERARVTAHFINVFKHEKLIIDFEYWINHKDGHELCILTNAYPKFDKAGNLIGYIGVDKDITDRKSKERSLSILNERLNTLIETIPDAIFLKDHESRWTIVNEAAKKMFAMSGFSWLGKTDKELAELRPEYHKVHQSCIASNEITWQSGKLSVFEEIITDANGINHQYQITKVPLFESNGERKGLVVVGKDVTKNKSEEQRLRLLETVITNTTEGIVITETTSIGFPDPKIIFVNDAYLKMTGYSREEIIGNKPSILQGVNTDRNELAKIRKAIDNFVPCEIEVINYKKSGEEFWTSIAIAPVFNAEGVPSHWIGIKRDISDSKKQEQKVKKAIITAQENEKYSIGRELHDNIAQILVGSLLTLGMVKNVSEKEIDWLQQTSENIHSAIDEIRELSHHLAPATFKNDSFITTVQGLLKRVNLENKFKIITHFDKFDNIKISSDIQLNLYRILQEQLQNIIKHAEATVIEISIKMVDNAVKMRINDNGKGFQTKSNTAGIGLRNIKNRAEMFSGFCSIKSSPDHGCELIVKIPVT